MMMLVMCGVLSFSSSIAYEMVEMFKLGLGGLSNTQSAYAKHTLIWRVTIRWLHILSVILALLSLLTSSAVPSYNRIPASLGAVDE